jgi:hypothetical protein
MCLALVAALFSILAALAFVAPWDGNGDGLVPCGTFIAGSLWIYLVGLPFALVGFAIIGPTRTNIERRQQALRALSSPLSLGQALMNHPSTR